MTHRRLARACLALLITSENVGARHAPEQALRRDYPDLVREIRYCARIIAEHGDAIAEMALADPAAPDHGMIEALETMGRAPFIGLPIDAINVGVLREWTTVSRLTGSHGFRTVRHPLGALAHLHDAAERVQDELDARFASSGSPGNRPNLDLHAFLYEVICSYRDIVQPRRLSAAPSKAGSGLDSSPLGRFVGALFDLMETPGRDPIALPRGWRPSASTLRQVVDRLNHREAA